MSISLSELARTLGSKTVQVRGLSLTIRALKDSEQSLVRRVLPPPDPPMVPDLTRGSLAPKVANEKDPAHLRVLAEHSWLVLRAEVALACGWAALAGLTDAAAKSQLEEAAGAMAEALTRSEILRLQGELYSVLDSSAQERARRSLIQELERGEEALNPPELPANYGETPLCLLLDVCRSYGMDPRTIDDIDPGLKAVLFQHEIYCRQREAARWKAPTATE